MDVTGCQCSALIRPVVVDVRQVADLPQRLRPTRRFQAAGARWPVWADRGSGYRAGGV